MDLIALARKLRPYIEQAAGSLEDADALEAVALFPAWKEEGDYQVGDRVRHSNTLYRCLQTHTAQMGWSPAEAPSLWAEVLIPDPDAIPHWRQPDSTNPYGKGDKVVHKGVVWVSDRDGNVWEPGVYGWSEAVTSSQ